MRLAHRGSCQRGAELGNAELTDLLLGREQVRHDVEHQTVLVFQSGQPELRGVAFLVERHLQDFRRDQLSLLRNREHLSRRPELDHDVGQALAVLEEQVCPRFAVLDGAVRPLVAKQRAQDDFELTSLAFGRASERFPLRGPVSRAPTSFGKSRPDGSLELGRANEQERDVCAVGGRNQQLHQGRLNLYAARACLLALFRRLLVPKGALVLAFVDDEHAKAVLASSAENSIEPLLGVVAAAATLQKGIDKGAIRHELIDVLSNLRRERMDALAVVRHFDVEEGNLPAADGGVVDERRHERANVVNREALATARRARE